MIVTVSLYTSVTNSAHAAAKYLLVVTLESGEIRHFTPTKIAQRDVLGICKEEYEYPFGENIAAINEKGVLQGQGKVNKFLKPKLIRHEKNSPEDEYEVQIDLLKSQLENGDLTQEQYEAEYEQYTHDKFVAIISCPKQASFSIYPNGNFLKIRVAGFDAMEFVEVSKFKSAGWRYKVYEDFFG